MTTSVVTPELDQELESLVSAETDQTALTLQGVVSLTTIGQGDLTMYARITRAGLDAATNIKSLTAAFERIAADRYAHWQRATKLRAKKLAPFEEVKIKASRLIGAYDQEAERLRLAEEARLQREENERAQHEQEEQRKLAEAESLRLSQEQAIADAVELEAAGDTKGAEAVLNNPAPVPVYVPPVYAAPVILQKTTPKVAGKSSVANWSFSVKRSPKCRAVGIHEPAECSVCLELVPREYLILNTDLVGKLVRAQKDKFSVPGIDATPTPGARFRG